MKPFQQESWGSGGSPLLQLAHRGCLHCRDTQCEGCACTASVPLAGGLPRPQGCPHGLAGPNQAAAVPAHSFKLGEKHSKLHLQGHKSLPRGTKQIHNLRAPAPSCLGKLSLLPAASAEARGQRAGAVGEPWGCSSSSSRPSRESSSTRRGGRPLLRTGNGP